MTFWRLGYEGASVRELADAMGITAQSLYAAFATPIVSGIVALMLQANPNLGARDIQNILALSARRIDPNGSNWTTNGAAKLCEVGLPEQKTRRRR